MQLIRKVLNSAAMIVCSCNVFSDGEVRACLAPGPSCPRTPAQVYQCLGCSPKCGRCARAIRAIMDKALTEVHASCAISCGAACPLGAKTEAVAQAAA
jgi:bacterioferritin-associated ferredoxin